MTRSKKKQSSWTSSGTRVSQVSFKMDFPTWTNSCNTCSNPLVIPRPSKASTWPLDSRSRMAAQVTFTSSIAIASLGKAWIWSFAYASNKAGMQNLRFDLMVEKVRMSDSNTRNQCKTNLECGLSNHCSQNPNAHKQFIRLENTISLWSGVC